MEHVDNIWKEGRFLQNFIANVANNSFWTPLIQVSNKSILQKKNEFIITKERKKSGLRNVLIKQVVIINRNDITLSSVIVTWSSVITASIRAVTSITSVTSVTLVTAVSPVTSVIHGWITVVVVSPVTT